MGIFVELNLRELSIPEHRSQVILNGYWFAKNGNPLAYEVRGLLYPQYNLNRRAAKKLASYYSEYNLDILFIEIAYLDSMFA